MKKRWSLVHVGVVAPHVRHVLFMQLLRKTGEVGGVLGAGGDREVSKRWREEIQRYDAHQGELVKMRRSNSDGPACAVRVSYHPEGRIITAS